MSSAKARATGGTRGRSTVGSKAAAKAASSPAQRARTALVALVLAGLVWVLAESQTLRAQSVRVQVAVLGPEAVAGAPVVRVAAGQGWNGSVEVELLGSSARSAQVIDRLRAPVTLLLGRELGELEAGRQRIDLREALRRAEVFGDAGVTIDAVSPAVLDVEVDVLEAIEVPVRVVMPGGGPGAGGDVELDGPAAAVPPVVMLTVPRRAVLERAAARDLAVQVVATLESDDVLALAAGREGVLPGVAVRLPPALADGAWAVSFEPSTVDVRLRVRGRLSRLVVERVPVEVRVAPAELGRWRVEIPPADRDLVGVTLVGPPAAIERVRSGEVRPVAVVALGFEQLELGVDAAEAVISGLPGGVRAEPAGAEVRLRITAVEGG